MPQVFATYIALLEDGGAANLPELARRLKASSKRAAEIMTKEMTERLEAYMPTLLALELIDPSASNADVMPIAPSTWVAMESLAEQCSANVGGINFDLLRRQVMDWRDVTVDRLAGAGEQRLRVFLHYRLYHNISCCIDASVYTTDCIITYLCCTEKTEHSQQLAAALPQFSEG